MNEHYRPLHQLCRLFIARGSVSEHQGQNPFVEFLLDLNGLFESYVTSVLQREAKGMNLLVRDQTSTRLDEGGQVKIVPDIIISAGGKLLAVADCKYKALSDGQFKNHDLYQVLAYCTALGTDRGALIYPAHAAPAEPTLHVRRSPIIIRHFMIDLDRTPNALRDRERHLARAIRGWAVG